MAASSARRIEIPPFPETTVMMDSLTRLAPRLVLLGAFACLGSVGGCGAPEHADDWTEYGNAAPTAMSAHLSGMIEEVCITKGCWMKVREADGTLTLVRFRDYGFFVPMNSPGHQTVAEGERRVRTYDQAQRRHLAKDAGATTEEIEAITGSTTQTIFIADGVRILGEGLDAPYAPATPEDCIVDDAPKGSEEE